MIKNILFVSAILSLSALAQLSLQTGGDWFQYSQTEISAGQWWRFITGNMIHLNWLHFAVNALAFVVIVMLLPDIMRWGELFVVFLLCCFGVTLGLWVFSPSVYWYVGLSGVLHGVLVVLLLLEIVAGKQLWSITLFVLVLLKLIWEGLFGALPGSESTVGGPVLVQAHSYGAVTGVVIFFVLQCKKYINNRKL